jgi:hypothetical protein
MKAKRKRHRAQGRCWTNPKFLLLNILLASPFDRGKVNPRYPPELADGNLKINQ